MLRSNIAATARAGNRRKGPLSALRAYTNHRRQKSYDGERYGRLSAPPGGPGQVASPFLTARAGNRRFWCLSAMRAHTKAPYKTDLHRKTLRELKRPGGPGQHVALPALAAVLTEGGGPAPPPSLRGGARAHPEAVRGGRHPRIVAAPVLAI